VGRNAHLTALDAVLAETAGEAGMFALYVALSALSAAGIAILAFVVRVCNTILDRRYYQRQGIVFVKTYPFIGSEVDVTDLIGKNKTRDYLYVGENAADFVGSIRGFDIQLYALNKETTEILIKPSTIGTYIDRDTPALYSFGQLSPSALTFTPLRTEHFHERKANILKGFEIGRMDEISRRLAREYSAVYAGARTLDMKRIVRDWTRDVMGEFVWGRAAMNACVSYKDRSGKTLQVPFMFALNETFTRLRFYSNRFWNRVYFPIATWPVTREARRLQYNIRHLQAHLATALKKEPAPDSVSYDVMRANGELGIPIRITRDDLLTVSIAGLDTVQSMILASLWYLLLPENKEWRDKILASDEVERERIVDACINEAIRLDPPGSVINNKTIKDFPLDVSGRKYRLKKGVRVMPNIHALHAQYGDAYRPGRFLEAQGKRSLYVMPFGKGRRSCPGQTIGVLMAKNYVKEFITKNPAATIMNTEDEHIHFNNLSRSKLMIGLPDQGGRQERQPKLTCGELESVQMMGEV
jgi:Cytochrome P450